MLVLLIWSRPGPVSTMSMAGIAGKRAILQANGCYVTNGARRSQVILWRCLGDTPPKYTHGALDGRSLRFAAPM